MVHNLITQAFENLKNSSVNQHFTPEAVKMFNGKLSLYQNSWFNGLVKFDTNLNKGLLKVAEQQQLTRISKPSCVLNDHDVVCNLKDNAEDRSNIAALNFRCPFDSPCNQSPINTVASVFPLPTFGIPGCSGPYQSSSYYTYFITNMITLNFFSRICMSPSYIFKISAETIDNRNTCQLQNYFYIHMRGVTMSDQDAFYVFMYFLLWLVIIFSIIWYLKRNEWERYTKIKVTLKSLEIYLVTNSKALLSKLTCGVYNPQKLDDLIEADDLVDSDMDLNYNIMEFMRGRRSTQSSSARLHSDAGFSSFHDIRSRLAETVDHSNTNLLSKQNSFVSAASRHTLNRQSVASRHTLNRQTAQRRQSSVASELWRTSGRKLSILQTVVLVIFRGIDQVEK